MTNPKFVLNEPRSRQRHRQQLPTARFHALDARSTEVFSFSYTSLNTERLLADLSKKVHMNVVELVHSLNPKQGNKHTRNTKFK